MDNHETEMNLFDIIKWTSILIVVELLLMIKEYIRFTN